ncbi:MAG TPA: hypothetical protein VNF71_14690, partial [Acidimicrobiales bacterium]|nr:hypothetical protein [Acidimicrobiales bacterium]
ARRAAGGVTEPSSGARQSRAAAHGNARPSNTLSELRRDGGTDRENSSVSITEIPQVWAGW